MTRKMIGIVRPTASFDKPFPVDVRTNWGTGDFDQFAFTLGYGRVLEFSTMRGHQAAR